MRFQLLSRFVLALFLFLGAPLFAFAAVPTDPSGTQANYAADMLNRFGVDTHIDFQQYGYQNVPQTIADINYLGDGLLKILRDSPGSTNDLAWWQQVAAGTGVKFDAFINEGCGVINPSIGCTSTVYTYDQSLMQSMVASGGNYLMGVEGGNEEDDSWPEGYGNSQYLAAQYQPTLWNWAQTVNFPVFNTTFGSGWCGANCPTGDYGTVGNLSAYATYANAHTYPQFSPTSYGDFQALNQDALLAASTRPVAITEYGWTTNTPGYGNVAPSVQAAYVPEGILDAYRLGDKYYFYYALYDDGSGTFGLFNTSNSPKPAATAVRNLYTLLGDAGSNALSFGAGKLNYSLSGMPATDGKTGGQQELFQKSDGTYWLALWNEQPLNDANGNTLSVGTVPVTLALGSSATKINVFDVLSGTTAVQTASNATGITFNLPAHPILIEVMKGTPAPSSPTAAAAVSVSAATLPDLIVTGVSWSPTSLTAGTGVTFNATVKNQGTSAVAPGTVIGVSFLVDGTQVSWSAVGAGNTAGLAPGASATLTADWGPNNTPLWTATNGSHTVEAFVDDANRITESNKSNNTLTVPLTVGTAPTLFTVNPLSNATVSGTVNFSGQAGTQWVNVAAFNVNNAYAKVAADATPSGGAYTLSVDTTKLPNGTAKIAVIAYSVPAGQTGGTSSEVDVSVNVQNAATATLATSPTSITAGQSTRLTWSSTNASSCTGVGFSASGTSGSLVVTPTQTTTYSLNCGGATAAAAVSVSAATLPDLIVTGVSWSPTSLTAGTGVTFNATVKNQGTSAVAPGTVIGVSFLVDGTQVSWSAVGAGNTAGLAPGASATLTADWGPNNTPLWTATNGSHTVEAFVDDANRITESNKSNNTLTVPLTVGTAPTLAVGSTVVTTANLNTHYRASTTSKILCVQPAGAAGTVTGGPTSAGGHTWWNVKFTTSCSGWVIGNYLATQGTATTSAPANSPAVGMLITHTLAQGWTGPEVSFLQTVLNKLGYFNASTTGYFGSLTASAVQAFQQAHNLEPVGIVGPKTRVLLDSLLNQLGI